ncbi:L-aspartate oxidase [Candidatus Sumerlaeota bacterium]|nr:L-aspartate oxidase [Candidatus Sumerlaeota bacterium]
MELNADVLVIGCGVAGCAAALAAARQGAHVLVLCGSTDPLESNTAHAQGGIIGPAPGDSPELLAHDILTAGAGLCDPTAVEHLARNAAPLLERLLISELGVSFDRSASGDLDMTEEGAHSLPRILHADDLTGRAIIEPMLEAVRSHPNVTFRAGAVAVDLLSLPARSANRLDIYRPDCCVGAYALDVETDTVMTVTAQQTILATGGLGQLFLHTTNPRVARGDGVAMAYRVGARLLNMEFVQFHPTTLFHRDADSFLISESLRGEGALLLDHKGEEFMKRYHPQGTLAPRDVVARAIQIEMLESGIPCVYLDITHKDPSWVRKRFPHIHKNCLKHGIDIATQRIPVVPAAHYACGGVAVDLLGRTTIPNLRAVGEVSCTGVHGANRLASTSLLEGLLWGWEAGTDAARVVKGEKPGRVQIPPIEPFIAEREPADPALVRQDWLTIKYTMWNYVGLTRTPKRLSRAMLILRELQYEVLSFYQRARPTDAVIGLRNGVTAALAILFAAQRNHTSVGCHYLTKD